MGKKALLSAISAILSSVLSVSAVPGKGGISGMSGGNYLGKKRQRDVISKNSKLNSGVTPKVVNSPKNWILEHPFKSAIGGVFVSGTLATIGGFTGRGLYQRHVCNKLKAAWEAKVGSEGSFLSMNDLQDFMNQSNDLNTFLKTQLEQERKNQSVKTELSDLNNSQNNPYSHQAFDKYAKICFEGDGFECYHKDRELALHKGERCLIKYVADHFYQQLRIKPCRVNRDGHCFTFAFTVDGDDSKMDKCVFDLNNYSDHYNLLKEVISAHGNARFSNIDTGNYQLTVTFTLFKNK